MAHRSVRPIAVLQSRLRHPISWISYQLQIESCEGGQRWLGSERKFRRKRERGGKEWVERKKLGSERRLLKVWRERDSGCKASALPKTNHAFSLQWKAGRKEQRGRHDISRSSLSNSNREVVEHFLPLGHLNALDGRERTVQQRVPLGDLSPDERRPLRPVVDDALILVGRKHFRLDLLDILERNVGDVELEAVDILVELDDLVLSCRVAREANLLERGQLVDRLGCQELCKALGQVLGRRPGDRLEGKEGFGSAFGRPTARSSRANSQRLQCRKW